VSAHWKGALERGPAFNRGNTVSPLLIDVIQVLVNAMHSGRSPYLAIWTYFAKIKMLKSQR